MWNYWGYIYFSDEDYDQAMYAYEQLLKEPEQPSKNMLLC